MPHVRNALGMTTQPVPATDRNGRPTLGHTGHGDVVASVVSRMHSEG